LDGSKDVVPRGLADIEKWVWMLILFLLTDIPGSSENILRFQQGQFDMSKKSPSARSSRWARGLVVLEEIRILGTQLFAACGFYSHGTTFRKRRVGLLCFFKCL